MTGIFDLSVIKKLVETESPSVLVVVDTMVLAGHPDLSRWVTSIHKPLFILPCMTGTGLEQSRKPGQSASGAFPALQRVMRRCRKSGIEEGVYKEGAGWFVSPPAPDRKSLKPELDGLDFLVKTLGTTDTGMLVLSRELSRAFPDLPLVLAAKNRDLYQAARFTGLNACLFRGFARLKLDKLPPGKSGEPVNWDDVLQGIQEETGKRVVQVDLTLLSRQCAPRWIVGSGDNSDSSPVIVAEGTGIIHASADIRFTWAMPFLSWNLPEIDEVPSGESASAEDDEEDDAGPDELALGTVYMDFGGRDNSVSPWVYRALARKISDCVSPLAYMEDMPTVQDPVTVMKQWLIFEFAFQERSEVSEVSRETLEGFEEKLRNRENLLDWARYWLRDRNAEPAEVDISFNEFLHAIRSCWGIGDTISIELRDDPAEVSNMRGEAEE